MITLTELFTDGASTIPQRYEQDIESHLSQAFARYVDKVADLNPSGIAAGKVLSQVPAITEISAGICRTLTLYLEGRTSESYARFERVMDQARPWTKDLAFPLKRLLGHRDSSSSPDQFFGDLYRMRIGPLLQYARKDLFHIPFDQRDRVATQRYSIPGLPCLYFGSSLWICWEELGRPDFSSIHAARFVGHESLQVLDLGWKPDLIEMGLSTTDPAEQLIGDFVIGQAVLWPLIASCSLIRRCATTPFAPEYVIPQFLLQWVRKEENLDGIRYFSTRIPGTSHSSHKALNFVFPVRMKAEQGYCSHLQSEFALTAPLAWPILQSWNPSTFGPGDMSRIGIGEGVVARYDETAFFKAETNLRSLQTEFLG